LKSFEVFSPLERGEQRTLNTGYFEEISLFESVKDFKKNLEKSP